MTGPITRELGIRFYLWVGDQSERLERNEATAEHSLNELVVEWEHLLHAAPAALASITGG